MNRLDHLPSPPEPPPGYLPVTRDLVPPGPMFWWTIGAFVAGVIGANILAVFLVAMNADLTKPVPFAMMFLGQVAASFLLIWMFSRHAASGSLQADVGLSLDLSDWWALLAGMGLQIVVAFATYPLIQVMFPDGAPEQGVAGIAQGTATSIEIILMFLSVAVLAPIVEEIIFRGMLMSWMYRFMGKWAAIILSAAVFASIHLMDWNSRAAVPGLFIIGIVLGWAAIKRGDLSLAIPLHAGVNLLGAALLIWGPEILEWSERQLEELESVSGVIRWVETLVGF